MRAIGCSRGWSSFRSKWALGDAEMCGLVARKEGSRSRRTGVESEAAVGLGRGLWRLGLGLGLRVWVWVWV